MDSLQPYVEYADELESMSSLGLFWKLKEIVRAYRAMVNTAAWRAADSERFQKLHQEKIKEVESLKNLLREAFQVLLASGEFYGKLDINDDDRQKAVLRFRYERIRQKITDRLNGA